MLLLANTEAAITLICDALLGNNVREILMKHGATNKHDALNKDKGATKLTLTK